MEVLQQAWAGRSRAPRPAPRPSRWPASSAFAVHLTQADLERMVEALRQELLTVERATRELDARTADAPPKVRARRLQLDVRRDLVTSRYRAVVELLEEQRVGQIMTDARQTN